MYADPPGSRQQQQLRASISQTYVKSVSDRNGEREWSEQAYMRREVHTVGRLTQRWRADAQLCDRRERHIKRAAL